MRADDQVIKLLELNLKRTIDTILKLFSINISGKLRRVTEMQRENTQCSNIIFNCDISNYCLCFAFQNDHLDVGYHLCFHSIASTRG